MKRISAQAVYRRKPESLTNIFSADSVRVSAFIFTYLSPEVMQQNLGKPTMKTDSSIK